MITKLKAYVETTRPHCVRYIDALLSAYPPLLYARATEAAPGYCRAGDVHIADDLDDFNALQIYLHECTHAALYRCDYLDRRTCEGAHDAIFCRICASLQLDFDAWHYDPDIWDYDQQDAAEKISMTAMISWHADMNRDIFQLVRCANIVLNIEDFQHYQAVNDKYYADKKRENRRKIKRFFIEFLCLD